MHDAQIGKLIQVAQERMRRSSDPGHDFFHAARVVAHIERFIADLDLTEEQAIALILAGWWHDVGRTITAKPSFVWMLFFDDMISALMLWHATIRYGVFGSIAGMSTRLIFCKSLGTGALFTKIFLRKKTRMLLNILKDADVLDIMNVDRIAQWCRLAENSFIYTTGYRVLAWYNFKSNLFKMKTHHGRLYLQERTQLLIEWMARPEVEAWHRGHFGHMWAERTKANVARRLERINSL